MPARHGKTLVELLVIISLTAVAMTVGARTMVVMMRSEQKGAQSLAATTTLSRLAREFRRDVHAAIDVEAAGVETVPNGTTELLLTQPDDSVIVYRSEPKQVHRVVYRGGRRHSREVFRLHSAHHRFESAADGNLVTLVHARRPSLPPGAEPDEGTVTVIRIEAVRGRDHRYTIPAD